MLWYEYKANLCAITRTALESRVPHRVHWTIGSLALLLAITPVARLLQPDSCKMCRAHGIEDAPSTGFPSFDT